MLKILYKYIVEVSNTEDQTEDQADYLSVNRKKATIDFGGFVLRPEFVTSINRTIDRQQKFYE